MSASVKIQGLDRLPTKNCLIVPGRMDQNFLGDLRQAIGDRPITWLAEESATHSPEVQKHLQNSGRPGASFSIHDPVEETAAALSESLENDRAVLVYVPGMASARPGAPCHIRSDVLKFLCQLKLPIAPLDISIPAEMAPAIENPAPLPAAVLTFGPAVNAAEASVARFRQSLLGAAEEAFTARAFLTGSLPLALLHGLKTHSRTCLFDGTDDSSLAFGKLLGVAIAFSKEIKKHTRKKRVGIILPPGKGGMIANLAVLFANKIPVNLNFTASQDAVRSSISQADIDKFITADPFVRKIPAFPWPPTRDLIFVERVLPHIKKSIVKWVYFAKILPVAVLAKTLGLGKNKDRDEAILLFTSGSSGEPKGVPLSHRNLLANVCQFGTPLGLQEGSKILGSLPLFHSFGCTVTLWYPIIQGIDIITYPSPLETKRLAELIQQHKIDLLLSTPTFLRGYMRRVEADQLKSLKLVVTGAEKLPENLAKSFGEKFGITPMEGYGLTETSPATNVNLPEDNGSPEAPAVVSRRAGSVGAALPGLAVKITNAASGKDSPLDQSGIIWFKGSNIFHGYLNQEKLSEDVLHDGWFKTGDVGKMDDDGMLFIEGRISRFSKIAGEMVPHESVEAHINQVLGLDNETERKIAVVGIPDEKKGEAILLLSTFSGEALEQECLDIRYKLMDLGIPSLWCPREILPVEEIPVLASGKLDIKGCKTLVEDLHGH